MRAPRWGGFPAELFRSTKSIGEETAQLKGDDNDTLTDHRGNLPQGH